MRPTVVAAVVASAAAHRQFLDMLPNGHTFYDVWPALGHVAPEPSQYQANAVTFPRNPFGLDFSANGYKWDRTLCEKDSDGDGVPNGVELGDPHCHWRVGDPVPTETPKGKLSHPGVPGVGINDLRAWWSTYQIRASCACAMRSASRSLACNQLMKHAITYQIRASCACAMRSAVSPRSCADMLVMILSYECARV